MEKEKSETQRLAETDTAIEIMAAKIGICMNRLLTEEEKNETEQDAKLIARLNKELDILAAERTRMYKGDATIKDRILNQYADEVKAYYVGKNNNVR